MTSHPARPEDRPWLLATTVAGTVATASYVGLSAVPAPPPVQVALVAGFAFGISVASLGLHHVVGLRTAPRVSLAATAANLVAAALLTAMLLVQLAVKAAEPRPGAAFTALWLGLDVAWDLYIGAGTLLFGVCLLQDARFGYWLGVPGIVVACALLILNVATFPTPPAEAGLLDVGPVVGLWYLAVTIRCGMLLRRRPAASR